MIRFSIEKLDNNDKNKVHENNNESSSDSDDSISVVWDNDELKLRGLAERKSKHVQTFMDLYKYRFETYP